MDDKVSGKYAQQVERGGVHATSARDFRSRPIRNAGHGPADGSADSDGIGAVVTAERAHVGDGIASIGTTVFGGDRLSTEDQGSVQIRAGAARLLLLSSSYGDSNIFNRQCARVHAVRLEGRDSRAVGRANDWAGKTAECPGTADNVEA
jgi:hypothetical protein